jgi:tetratricopeptide (TPR) repeat protein
VINLAVNGNLQFERNAYQEAINWYLKAIEAGEVPAWVYWNTACAYAHLDQKEAAITNLNQAVELGFTDLEYIQKSKHFIRWHQTEDWKALLHKLAVG